MSAHDSSEFEDIPSTYNRRPTWIIAVVVILAVIAGLVIYGVVDSRRTAERAIPPDVSGDGVGIVVNPEPVREGVPVVDVYFDYQCPACGQLDGAFGQTMLDMAKSGKIALVHHPLNFTGGQMGNTSSTRAAIGSVCADFAGKGKHGLYHHAVFREQPLQMKAGQETYSDELLRETIPQAIGITGAALVDFQRCYDDRVPAPFLAKVSEGATKAGVSMTPTLARNGTPLTIAGKITPEDFEEFLLTGKAPPKR